MERFLNIEIDSIDEANCSFEKTSENYHFHFILDIHSKRPADAGLVTALPSAINYRKAMLLGSW